MEIVVNFYFNRLLIFLFIKGDNFEYKKYKKNYFFLINNFNIIFNLSSLEKLY